MAKEGSCRGRFSGSHTKGTKIEFMSSKRTYVREGRVRAIEGGGVEWGGVGCVVLWGSRKERCHDNKDKNRKFQPPQKRGKKCHTGGVFKYGSVHNAFNVIAQRAVFVAMGPRAVTYTKTQRANGLEYH